MQKNLSSCDLKSNNPEKIPESIINDEVNLNNINNLSNNNNS